MRAVYVVGAVAAVSRDAARIIAAPSAIPSLYLRTFSEPGPLNDKTSKAHVLGACRARRPSDLGFGCRDRRRRASG